MSNLIFHLRIWCFHVQIERDRPWLPRIRYNDFHRRFRTPFIKWYE
jgi:hypothetical protein